MRVLTISSPVGESLELFTAQGKYTVIVQEIADSTSRMFAGTMNRVSRVGPGIPFPEYKIVGAPGYANPPEKWTTDQLFELIVTQEITSGVNVQWVDERHVGTHAFPAVGPATLSGDHLSASLVYGAYAINIDGTITGTSFAGTVTTTVRGTVEVYTIASSGPTSTLTFVAGTYVSQFGNDSNDGLSLLHPKLTPPAPVELGQVYEERGSIFTRGILSLTDQHSVIGVGVGWRPVTNQFDVVHAWTLTSGVVWSAVVHGANNFDPLSGAHPNVIEDGVILQHVQNVAAVQATAGSFAVSGTFSGGAGSDVTVWIHATGGGDPNSNGKSYEVSTREAAFCGHGSSHFESLIGRGNTTNLVIGTKPRAFDGTEFAKLNNLTSWFGIKHNFSFFSGEFLQSGSVQCQNADWNLGSNHIVAARIGNDTAPTTFVLSDFYMITKPGSHLANDAGLLLEVQTGVNPLGIVTVHKPYIAYLTGPGFAQAVASTVFEQQTTECLAERMGKANQALYSTGKWVATKTRMYSIGVYSPGCFLTDTTVHSFSAPDSLFVTGMPDVGLGNAFVNMGSSSDPAHPYVYRLGQITFFRNGPVDNNTQMFASFGANLDFQIDSIAVNGGVALGLFINGAPPTTRTPGDHNLWGNQVNPPSGGYGYWWHTNYKQFPDYQSGDGLWPASDAASTAGAVSFTNTTGRYPACNSAGGYTDTFVPPADYEGVAFLSSLEAAGQMPL